MESTTLRMELYRIKSEKQMLEAKVLEYRNILDKLCDDLSENWGCYKANTYLEDFDKHFNIQTDRQGYID